MTEYETSPEAALDDTPSWVAAARTGAQWAFQRLYQRYAPCVHGILLSRHASGRAEELTQECFIRAFARLDQLRDHEKFAAWIAQIARRLDAHPSRADVVELDERTLAIASGQSPEDAAEASQILRALRTLPDSYRETLCLRLIEGMSGAEIAAVTGLTPESVRVNLHRGMSKLRTALGLNDLSDGTIP